MPNPVSTQKMIHGNRRKARRAAILAITGATAIALTACSSSSSSSNSSSGTKAPIQIGYINTFSGPEAVNGTDAWAGVQVALSEINKSGGVLGGHQLEIVKKDDQYTPSVAVQDLRSLNADGIHLVIGGTNTDVCLSMLPLLQPLDTLLLTAECSDDYFTQPKAINPLFFRVNTSSASLTGALGVQMCKSFKGATKFYALNLDYTIVHLGTQQFANAVSSCGIKQAKVIYMPATVTNTLPYVQSLLSAVPANGTQSSILFLGTFGAPLLNAFKVGLPIGLESKFRAVGTFATAFDSTAAELYPNVPSVYSTSDYYPTAFNTTANSNFVSDFKELNHGTAPNTTNFVGFRTLEALAAAIDKAGSTDTAKVAAAMAHLSIPDPQGTLTVNPTTHQANVYVVIRHYQGSSVTILGTVPFEEAVAAAKLLGTPPPGST